MFLESLWKAIKQRKQGGGCKDCTVCFAYAMWENNSDCN